MSQPSVLILRAPGTNCDAETAFAFATAGARPEVLHVNRLRENPAVCRDFQILCIPGGFSYGDDLAAGRILGNQIRHHLAGALEEFRAAGKLILGICNGFQVLIKSGILLADLLTASPPLPPGEGRGEGLPATRPHPNPLSKGEEAGLPPGAAGCLSESAGNANWNARWPATLTWNDSGRFEARWVRLVVRGDRSVFLRGIDEMYLPVAHAEGKFVARDADVLGRLDKNGQLVLRYTTAAGHGQNAPYPENPNGSQLSAAGVCDETGQVLGLMPHPERHLDPTHHPRWTRGEAGKVGDGLKLFQNAVEYFG